MGFGFDDIHQRLPGIWRVTEGDEVGGVASSEAFAYYRILFEAANARAMAAARINDDHWLAAAVDALLCPGEDS
jgi:hypothetical protein